MSDRYKPIVKYKIVSAYWWNPFFWAFILLGFPCLILMGLYQGLKDCWELIITVAKEYDLK